MRRTLIKLAAALILFSTSALAETPENCRGHSCNEGGDLAVETVIRGDTTKILSVGGADMEISDCVATYSILFGIWQDIKTNKLGCANQLQREGKYEAAAKMRCSVRGFRKPYGTREECEEAVITRVPEPDEPSPDQEARYQAMEKALADMQVTVAAQAELVKRPAPRPRPVQQPYLSEKQQAALKELFGEDLDND